MGTSFHALLISVSPCAVVFVFYFFSTSKSPSASFQARIERGERLCAFLKVSVYQLSVSLCSLFLILYFCSRRVLNREETEEAARASMMKVATMFDVKSCCQVF